jgi:hypothetical protein
MTKTGLLMFCMRSLGREYGWLFMSRIVFRHPVRTLRGLLRYMGIRRRPEISLDGRQEPGLPGTGLSQGETLVGLGFCLKPLDPQCPSGRANHDCEYFQRALHLDGGARPPLPCRDCSIRDLGLRALESGWAFYIMTSARDILFDILLPVLEERRFRHALLGLCRYSIEPFRIATAVVGLEAQLLTFSDGECADYRAWLLADRGIKNEQTCFSAGNLTAFREGISGMSGGVEGTECHRVGNVFFPLSG